MFGNTHGGRGVDGTDSGTTCKTLISSWHLGLPRTIVLEAKHSVKPLERVLRAHNYEFHPAPKPA